jgi:hypothetical protein
MDRKRHASLADVCCRGHGSDRVLDVLSSLGSQTFGWMGMYGSALSPVVSSLTILVQGIWEPNVEYADGDYVD